MSKYTTEVRRIVETYANDNTASIVEQIDKAAPYIFDSTWSATTEEKKSEIERKILRHYYTQEIGYETVGAWKLHLNAKLAEIMPRYNVIYAQLDSIKTKLFETADWNEESESTGTSADESTASGKTTAETTDHGTSYTGTATEGKTTGTGKTSDDRTESTTEATESATEANNSGTGDAWQKYNDTPQGAIQGLESDTYLTNAAHNVNETTGKTNTTGNTSNSTTGTQTVNQSTEQNTATEGTSNTNAENSTETKTNSTSENNSTNKGSRNSTAARHVYGKNSGGSYLSELLKLEQEYRDVDEMIVREVSGLFMGLWE